MYSIRHIPTIGILLFLALYIYATSLYPGGSHAIPEAAGWDWYHNLWCNLMSDKAINGQENPASIIARFAAAVLATSLAVFYFLCAKFFVNNKTWKAVIKISGIVLVTAAVFIFSKYHDIMTTIISVCGLNGIVGILQGLYQHRMIFFVAFGLICLLVIGLNNLFYYNESLNEYLPLVQHLDFVLILSWTVVLNIRMLKRNKTKEIGYERN